jgi:hypothetical protein
VVVETLRGVYPEPVEGLRVTFLRCLVPRMVDGDG